MIVSCLMCEFIGHMDEREYFDAIGRGDVVLCSDCRGKYSKPSKDTLRYKLYVLEEELSTGDASDG